MNERQLRCLKVIASERNIRKASHVLSRNPSSLTRMLKNTEEELGVSLFVRAKDGLRATPEGESFFLLAENVLRQFDELRAWICAEVSHAGSDPAKTDRADGGPAKTADSDGGREHAWTENEIRYLLTTREYGNISRAAQELYIAQPSLSQVVMEVEDQLGRPIFVRSKDGVRETPFGRELLKRLEMIRQGIEKLYAEMEEFQQMKRGKITFGIPMNLGTYLIPLLLPAFLEAYPGIQVHIRENNTLELEKLLTDRKIDFCIMHDQGHQESLEYTEFSDDPFYLVVPGRLREKYQFPKDQVLTAKDLTKLKGEPFVMVAARQKLRQVVDQILSRVGIRPRICCTTRSMETAKRLVAAGMGVTFLPGSYMTLYSGTEGLEWYPIDEKLGGHWKLVVANRKHESLSRGSREFLRILRERLKADS